MPSPSDPTTRSAALWATVVALPVTVLAGLLIFSSVSGRSAAAPRSAPAKSTAASTAPATIAAVPSAPVPLAAPRLAARAAAVCPAVLDRMPVTVRDLPRRAVTAGPRQNAAYGEPAITLQCGVAQPAMCPSLEQTRPGCVPLP